MASATLNLKIIPRRILSRLEAAAYCGIPAKTFETKCPVRPIELPGGVRAFDMADLDKWLDDLKGGDDTELIIARLT